MLFNESGKKKLGKIIISILLKLQCSLQFCVKIVDIAGRKIGIMVILVIFFLLIVHKYMKLYILQ